MAKGAEEMERRRKEMEMRGKGIEGKNEKQER